MTTTRTRLVILVVLAGLGAAGAWLIARGRPGAGADPDMITTVDTRADLAQVLAERAASAPPEDALPPVRDPRLRREELDLETARLFFPPAGRNRPYNTHFWAPNEPNVEQWFDFADHPAGGFTRRTNSLGMLEDAEVAAVKPDLRVLVAGDSHGAGLCANEESFTNRLEARLADADPARSVEALNASAGGYHAYNYLGVLEAYLGLQPDVFVMAVYGGNDFGPMMQLQRYFHRRGPARTNDWSPELLRSLKPVNIASQELSQAAHFRNNPEDVDLAIETLDAITLEAERLCREHGIHFVLMYLPTPFLSQPRFFGEDVQRSLAATGLDARDLHVSDRIANRWLARAAARGVDLLDLRETFRSSPEMLYNRKADCHINLRAHALIGELLAERILAGRPR